MYEPLTAREEWLAKEVVDVAIKIHKELGPGLLESVYEQCFCYELFRRGITCERQKAIPVLYEDIIIENGLRIDILVDDLLIVELKAQADYHPVWSAQLLSYLKLSNKRIGFIINFHVTLMKDGIKRMIL